jgi:tRNA-dihydrouridine synthase A
MGSGMSCNIISIAPMLGMTNQFFRYLMRLISQQVLLYTEMVTTPAILRGDMRDELSLLTCEHPVVLQLAGNDPKHLAQSARIGAEYGYDEINFNVGCPSHRMQVADFGVCLMRTPETVADCVNAMCEAVNIPVTAKIRLSDTDKIDMVALYRLIKLMSCAGCQTFVIHARGTILKKGWTPKANRSRLPLAYEKVYQLQQSFPQLGIVLNGGITDLSQINEHLQHTAGVMLGRAAYKNPYMFKDFDSLFYQKKSNMYSRETVKSLYLDHIHQHQYRHVPMMIKLKPLLHIYHGEPHASTWCQQLIAAEMR